jgi:outer membrane scaffolding protein for murein synthesis (MipA/OmpV family)
MNPRRLALLACFLPALALAQSEPDSSTLIGAGIRSRPAYDGSRSQRTDIVPVLNIQRKLWFARTVQGILEGGAHKEIAPGLNVGAQLAYEEGRKRRESDFLRERNVSDLDPSASWGLHLEGDQKIGPIPLTVLVRWRNDLNSDRGSQLDFRLTAGVYQSGALALGVFGQATWATQKAVRTYYGQPGFNPSGGPLFTTFGVLGSYDLSRRWVVVGSVEARHLRGEAASSPLVERRDNHYATAGLAYRF